MYIQRIEHFDLAQICGSGQCFRMSVTGEGAYVILAGERYLEVRQQGTEFCFDCDESEFEHFWKKYFDLEQDYALYTGQIDEEDVYLKAAAVHGAGIRILHQELWEMIVSFLISQQNNIVRIRRCIQNLCEAYGEEKRNGRGQVYYAFPEPEALAVLEEDALKACNLGYRSKYVVRAARSVVSGELDLEAVGRMAYPEAKAALLRLYGVGEKVADCICLFGLHHLEAFPVDTHINQAMEKHYKRGFPMKRYSGVQGVMQQYIFYYELAGIKEEKAEPD